MPNKHLTHFSRLVRMTKEAATATIKVAISNMQHSISNLITALLSVATSLRGMLMAAIKGELNLTPQFAMIYAQSTLPCIRPASIRSYDHGDCLHKNIVYMEATAGADKPTEATFIDASSTAGQQRNGVSLIANPIYDVVFKFLMEDNAIAKLMVSSIIGEEVVWLDPKPQEYVTEKFNVGQTTHTVYRLDFNAKIKTSDGFKLVLIEMQKATLMIDIVRFRAYLGRQYAHVGNIHVEGDGKSATTTPLQIYAIYFLGNSLQICDTPVLRVYPNVVDVATNEVVEKSSTFIESLNHKCWIVQISCLKKRRRSELETLLSVFDQSYITSDNHILNVREEDFPEAYRHIVRRLKMAASNQEVKESMRKEDMYLLYLKDVERTSRAEERAIVQKEMEGVIAQKDQDLAQTKQALAQKDQDLAQKDLALEAERKKNEALLRQLAELKKQT